MTHKKAQLWAGQSGHNRNALDRQPAPVVRRLTRVTETQLGASLPHRQSWRLEWVAVADSTVPSSARKQTRPPRAAKKRNPHPVTP